MRLIDADALIDVVDGNLTDGIAEGIAIEKIMEQPTVDPVRHGKWLLHGEPPWYVRECSLCHEKTHHWSGYEMPHFCGNCGARMDG